MPINEHQLKFCLEIMEKLKRCTISEIFFKPLDQNSDILPTNYSDKIVKKIDLSTIYNNLQNGFYKTIRSWKKDVDFVWKNFFILFPPEDFHYIIAEKLQETFNKLVESKSDIEQSDWETELMDLYNKYESVLTNKQNANISSDLPQQSQSESPIISSIYVPSPTIKPYYFKNSLVEGVIEKRLSQFTMMVNYKGISYKCHCPTTGRVGSFDLSGRPCLLSPSTDTNRKTSFTVEAVSLNRPTDLHKKWIGINQNEVNRYVEHFLNEGGFSNMVPNSDKVLREQTLGNSKIDFLVGNTYLEVKTPLLQIQLDIPDYVMIKKCSPFSSTDRMTRHITELGNSLKNHQRAILLTVFIYDNPGFKVIEKSANYEDVQKIVDENVEKGVELWQANFKIEPAKVTLEKYFKISVK